MSSRNSHFFLSTEVLHSLHPSCNIFSCHYLLYAITLCRMFFLLDSNLYTSHTAYTQICYCLHFLFVKEEKNNKNENNPGFVLSISFFLSVLFFYAVIKQTTVSVNKPATVLNFLSVKKKLIEKTSIITNSSSSSYKICLHCLMPLFSNSNVCNAQNTHSVNKSTAVCISSLSKKNTKDKQNNSKDCLVPFSSANTSCSTPKHSPSTSPLLFCISSPSKKKEKKGWQK